MTVKKKKREYVNNKELLAALIEYKQQCLDAESNGLPDPKIPNYIGECWQKIAEGISHKPNFINYPYKDDMIADGVENCLMYFRNFNPDKSKNPFAYFTQIIKWAFVRRIQKEKKQLYVKCKATEQMGILDEYELLELENGDIIQFEMYDNISEFIQNFENSRKNKKAAAKKPKGLDIFLQQ